MASNAPHIIEHRRNGWCVIILNGSIRYVNSLDWYQARWAR